jgi:hypothetical protein
LLAISVIVTIFLLKPGEVINMTEIDFSMPATLLALEGKVAMGTVLYGGPVGEGSLGRLVGKVMSTAPDERWRYSILTDRESYMTVSEIEMLAATHSFAEWQAGQ